MCTYSYTRAYTSISPYMGNRCPYPEIYERARSTASSVPETESTLELPVDDRGACIFHSQDITWKRKNNFKGKFLQLVHLLNSDGGGRDYDFVEFVFVGNDPRKNRAPKSMSSTSRT